MNVSKKISLIILLGSLLFASLACSLTTPEPTAEPTLLPTKEPTKVPPTKEPTAAAEVNTDTEIQKKSDGTSLFIDHQGKYQLSMPKNWILVELSNDSAGGAIGEAVDNIAEENPDISEELFNMGVEMVAEGSRFFAVDLNEGHSNDQMTTSAFSVISEDVSGFELSTLVDMTAQSLPAQLPDVEILLSDVETNASGTELGVIEYILTLNDESGTPVNIYERMVFIKNNDLVTMLVLVTNMDLFPVVSTDFDKIQESIVLLP